MADAAPRVTAAPRADTSPLVTLVVEEVHVTYRVFEDRRPSLGKFVARGLRPRAYREVRAVRGLSLTARSGESIGIIGRNGCGKSTLLKTMAGLLPPTSGRVLAHTEPTLLGVSAALNSSLSGRRNVLLGCLAMGMPRREAEERFDDIVDFAGVREFIDMPMRTYSSGMKARLHFAISSAVMPEVLLVDETLAVGDEDFRERSNERIAQLRHNAGTVFLVSHSMSVILQMCTRVIYMEAGRVALDGEPEEVVDAYRATFKRRGGRSQVGAD